MLPTSILCLSTFALSLVLEPFPGSTTHAFLVPRPFISPANGIRPTRLPITAPRETSQNKRGPWSPRLFVRRKSEREERDEEEEYGDEEEDYGDEEEEYQDEVARMYVEGREWEKKNQRFRKMQPRLLLRHSGILPFATLHSFLRVFPKRLPVLPSSTAWASGARAGPCEGTRTSFWNGSEMSTSASFGSVWKGLTTTMMTSTWTR